MKILFITDIGSPWGGSEELWSKSALLLKKSGHDIIASLPWYCEEHPKLNVLKSNNIKLKFRKNKLRILFDKARNSNDSIFLKFILSGINYHIKTTNPEFIVFSQSHVFSAYKNMLFAKRFKIKYCFVTQLNSELSWANDNNYLSIRNAFKSAEKAFFVSNGNLKLCELQLAYKLKNAEVISNPFNFDNIKQLDWPKTSTLNFAYVGRLDFTHKGIDILLNAFATKEWKSRDFKLNIYGKGNLSLAKELVNFLGLEDKVIFKGHVNNIHSIWEKNHILALASRYEGMPLVLIEAMLCRRTAIVTDVAGHAELITDKENGFLAEASHVKLFRKKLEEVWINKNDLKILGEKSYQTINQKLENKPEIIFSNKLIELINK